MSCMLVGPDGCCPPIMPLPMDSMNRLSADGLKTMVKMLGGGLDKLKPKVAQFIGAGRRPDGSAFYLTTAAPTESFDKTPKWTGAFYAPFGFAHIAGTATAEVGDDAAATLTVAAALYQDKGPVVGAKWTVIGPNPKNESFNRMAMIKGTIDITDPGPHDPDDIRKCIALHAPQLVWGEPKAVVAFQCGVAAACLIEAIC